MSRLKLAAITDEFSPMLPKALGAMRKEAIENAELRVVNGKNILDLTDDELARAKDDLAAFGMQVCSIASPLLKCVLPDGPELDTRFQQDAFASKHKFEDQGRLAEKAMIVAQFFHAPIVRVFSYWRTTHPESCFDGIAKALSGLQDAGLQIALENEHACNVGTAAEAARMLQAVPGLQLVWDPANALVAGEQAFPQGYSLLPKCRIAHVHAKDCTIENGLPLWCAIGTGSFPWAEQIQALKRDGYEGAISLETHWAGPCGDKLEGSRICARRLRNLIG